ncbi:hypothetical protein P167DRAFT_593745 [Morchella conica CCBAS932]|uniref:Uncharacterized protein n=1 Tax=Morchella conica CCBAS932 TaxID=1392247 RepID=A0A3N4KGI5_9PEZI|nr:hypothetical protein P167DRAFT_593745 [Morchella conica CCBAS932]
MANRSHFPYREKVTEAERLEREELQTDDGPEASIDQGVLLDQGDTDGTGVDAITNDFGGLFPRNELLYVPDHQLVPKSVKTTSLDRALAYLDSTSGNSGPTGNYALQRFIQSPTVPLAHLADPFSLSTASTDQESRHEMDRPSDPSYSEPFETIRSYSQPTYGINGEIVQTGNLSYLAKHNPVFPPLPSGSRLQLGNLQQQQIEAGAMGRATQSSLVNLELESPGPSDESKSERESVTTGIGSSLDRLRALRQRSTNPSTNRSSSNMSLDDDLELLDFDFDPPITTGPREVEFPIEDIINTQLVDNVSVTPSGRVNITPTQNHQFVPEWSLLLDYPQNIVAPEGTAQNSGQAISSMSFSSSFLVAPPDSSQFTPPSSGMGYYPLEGLPRAQYGLFPPPGVMHSHGIPTPISQSSFEVQNPYGIQTPMPQSSFAIECNRKSGNKEEKEHAQTVSDSTIQFYEDIF